MSKFRSPLSKAVGDGSAKHGAHHWIAQRLTAIALLPLMAWVLYTLATLPAFGELSQTQLLDAVIRWLSFPTNAALSILTIVTMLYHAQLGLQVVIEDYVSSKPKRITLLVLIKLAAAGGALLSLFAILSI